MEIHICDDDSVFCTHLNTLINEFFKQRKYALPTTRIFHSGDELLKCSTLPDILFLDIEMPGVDGIYVGNTIHKSNPSVIIFVVTSFSEYLDDAMRFNVYRYLSKPIDKQRLYRNLQDALIKYENKISALSVRTSEGYYTVSLTDIVMVETLKRKVIIHTTKTDLTSTENMTFWENTLTSQSFFLCHRCNIINFKYINRYDKSSVDLYGGKFTAYIAKKKYNEFKSRYLLYLENNSQL